jgi:hypothetical protein
MALDDWDARLLSPERALRLAGDWPIFATAELAELSQFQMEGGGPGQRDRSQINMRCGGQRHNSVGICGQSCGLLGEDRGDDTMPVLTSIGDLLSGVLRHMVMTHDVPLNGAQSDGN